jgi:hypothetical protein
VRLVWQLRKRRGVDTSIPQEPMHMFSRRRRLRRVFTIISARKLRLAKK